MLLGEKLKKNQKIPDSTPAWAILKSFIDAAKKDYLETFGAAGMGSNLGKILST